ncbi:MAG TPA: outer membrane beta-barrel protein [Steroidobacteraceae bacterium]|nr:outer membrane beta-barrel protein [Steroidobacteraceae bacterium]
MCKRLGLSVLAVLGLAAATAVQADTQPGFYAGVGFGTTTIDDDGFAGAGIDDSDTGFKLFGGYNFNENLAVEASYFDFGEASGRFSDPFFGSASFDVGISGLSASVVGRLPVAETFALFGKIGFASYDVDASVNISGTGGSGSQSETDMIYGIGGSLSFAQRFEARVEYEALNVDGGDASMISVSGVYRF